MSDAGRIPPRDAARQVDREKETATEKERTKVRAEMKEKQVKEAGELERKIEEARIDKLRATKLAEADRIQTDAGITTQKGKDVVAEEKAKVERERILADCQCSASSFVSKTARTTSSAPAMANPCESVQVW